MTDRKRRLLVVDDEPDFSNLVRRVGEDLGYEVTVCNRSAQFAQAYEKAEPDVIVLDIVMPEVEGIEIVQWLGQRGTNARVVVVTGYNPRYAETAKTIGAARGLSEIQTLTKPVRLASLRAALAPQGATRP